MKDTEKYKASTFPVDHEEFTNVYRIKNETRKLMISAFSVNDKDN